MSQSPDDLALGSFYTRDLLEEMFRLKKGSLVIPSDGEAFEKAMEVSAWSSYTGIGMQLHDETTLIGEPGETYTTNDLTIYVRHKSGLYYQELFVGNENNVFGLVVAIVGISGNQYIGCSYEGSESIDPPSPLVPIGGTDPDLPCEGPFLADLNEATCSYGDETGTLSYEFTSPIIPGNPTFSQFIASRNWISFSDLDVYADLDPNGNEWPQWILDNRDELIDEGKTSNHCSNEVLKKKRKAEKASKDSLLI